jgi:DNA-directed RNA polymerase subunit N (RpoN/RPB10)
MQIVLPWNQGIEQYQSDFKNLQIERPRRCLGCGCGKFHKWGKYIRCVIAEKTDFQICIQRIRCVKCGETHSYLPSFCVSGLS